MLETDKGSADDDKSEERFTDEKLDPTRLWLDWVLLGVNVDRPGDEEPDDGGDEDVEEDDGDEMFGFAPGTLVLADFLEIV